MPATAPPATNSSSTNLNPNSDLHLSFSGCGFQGLYHIGVATCIRKHAPYLFDGKIAGCSAGGLIAAAAICNCPMDEATRWSLSMVRKARSRSFGPFHPSFDLVKLLRVGFEDFLPPNAHTICNGRLNLSLTTLPDRQNVVVNQFKSREELINALICTCWIPFFAGFIPPVFEGKRYIDGGFTNNILILDENTITVTPFCGGGDISPVDPEHTFNYVYLAQLRMEVSAENLGRFARIFYPPNAKEVLSDLCKRGYDDAFNYLQQNNLMSCGDKRCLNSSASLFNLKKYRRKASRGSNLAYLGSMSELEKRGVSAIIPEEEQESRHQLYKSTASVNAESSGPKSSGGGGLQPAAECGAGQEFQFCESCPECCRMRDGTNRVLPDNIVTALQSFTMHESLYNYICSYKLVQLVGLLTLPVRLPMEAVFHNGKKLLNWLPFLPDDFGWLAVLLGGAVHQLLKKTGKDIYIARFQCEFELVDVDDTPILTRPVSYCSLHSAVNSRANSRRESLCVENITISRRGSYSSNSGDRFNIDVTIGCESRNQGLSPGQYREMQSLDYHNASSDEEDGIIFFAAGHNQSGSSHDNSGGCDAGGDRESSLCDSHKRASRETLDDQEEHRAGVKSPDRDSDQDEIFLTTSNQSDQDHNPREAYQQDSENASQKNSDESFESRSDESPTERDMETENEN